MINIFWWQFHAKLVPELKNALYILRDWSFFPYLAVEEATNVFGADFYS